MKKEFDFKKFMSNNAIIILIILLAVVTGCTTKNFFTDHKRYRPFRRTCSWFRRLPFRNDAAER